MKRLVIGWNSRRSTRPARRKRKVAKEFRMSTHDFCPHCGAPLSEKAVRVITEKSGRKSSAGQSGMNAAWFFFLIFIAVIAFSVMTAGPK